jgi:alkylation response protein AidB-like acyl-CoA dehydrogenase
MPFVLSESQYEFRDLARSYFEAELPLERAVGRVDGADDASGRWKAAADQLGLNALMVPVACGGLGGSFLDLAMVIEEAGRSLAGLPLCTSAMAGAVLAEVEVRTPGGVAADLLSRLAGSSVVVPVVAVADATECAVREDDRGRLRLSGRSSTVLDAPQLDAALVFAAHGDDGGLFLVEPDPTALAISPTPTMDQTRRFGRLEFDGVPATLVAPDPDGSLRRLALAAGRTALALDSAGGARRCLELAVDYAKQREQFGRPIGSFQAIKHKCADMLLKVESATFAAEAAAATLSRIDRTVGDVAESAALAKAYACDAYCWVAGELIQVLGGIGFTWEHPAHLFFKRAKANALLLGTPEQLRAEEARHLDLVST